MALVQETRSRLSIAETESIVGLRVRKLNEIDPTDPDVLGYASFLPNLKYLDHFRWPLLLDPRFEDADLRTLYDTAGKPRPEYTAMVAERLAEVIHNSARYVLLAHGKIVNPTTGEVGPDEVLAGGLTDPESSSENEAWLNNLAVRPDAQNLGLGSTFQIARIDEIFKAYSERTNLYVGFNILEPNVRFADAKAIDLAYKHADILDALLANDSVDLAQFLSKIDRVQKTIVDNHYSLQLDDQLFGELLNYAEQELPVHGLSDQSLRVRRDLIRGLLRAYGHDTTINEGILLKLGGYLTQMLPEEVRTMRVKSRRPLTLEEQWLPIRRLLMRREVWEQVRQFQTILPVTTG